MDDLEDLVNRTIKVININKQVVIEDLDQKFGIAGNIQEIYLICEPDEESNQCYITYEDEETIGCVMILEDTEFYGQQIQIMISNDFMRYYQSLSINKNTNMKRKSDYIGDITNNLKQIQKE